MNLVTQIGRGWHGVRYGALKTITDNMEHCTLSGKRLHLAFTVLPIQAFERRSYHDVRQHRPNAPVVGPRSLKKYLHGFERFLATCQWLPGPTREADPSLVCHAE